MAVIFPNSQKTIPLRRRKMKNNISKTVKITSIKTKLSGIKIKLKIILGQIFLAKSL